MERTPTNKESDTQLIENQHFVIGQENGQGTVAWWAISQYTKLSKIIAAPRLSKEPHISIIQPKFIL
ncbi:MULTISPECIES: hypothetical protein [unclassified Pseudobutyrivibrio]|uniref:hypothetical protein n=1 Tax=unclassified Pseudobutyrivibrio TaxID=2638619 RepID=UPI000B7D7A91|nr:MULTISPECIES: hypothetical protein [unclassified Pseudobutyrivibrio]